MIQDLSIKINKVGMSDEFIESLRQDNVTLKKKSKIKRFFNKVKST